MKEHIHLDILEAMRGKNGCLDYEIYIYIYTDVSTFCKVLTFVLMQLLQILLLT